MGRGKRPATYEDIEALPPGWVGEIIDDELWAFPRPAKWHAWVASVLGVRLGAAFGVGEGGEGGWWFVDEPELHLGRQVLVPDMAAWRYERAPGLFERDAPFFDLVPDWVCEVLSPSTAALDRGRKLPLYHREGVSHAWLVDPRAHALEVYRRGSRGWRLSRYGGDEVVRAEPFDAEPLDLGEALGTPVHASSWALSSRSFAHLLDRLSWHLLASIEPSVQPSKQGVLTLSRKQVFL